VIVVAEVIVGPMWPLLTVGLKVGGNSKECFDTLALFVVIIVLAGILTVIVAGADPMLEFTMTFGDAEIAYGFGTRKLFVGRTALCFAKICEMSFELNPNLMSCGDGVVVVNLKDRKSAPTNAGVA
jgi:hypothetical protein